MHPFVGTNDGIKAQQTLAAMIDAGTIRVVGKAGAWVMITESLKELARTIIECDAIAMSLTEPIKWDIISMREQDLEKLQWRVLKCLRKSKLFVWFMRTLNKDGLHRSSTSIHRRRSAMGAIMGATTQ